MLVVLLLAGVVATFFSAAKYGLLPDLLTDAQLSRGNGVLQLTTLLGILLGGAAGSLLQESRADAPWIAGLVLLATSAAGLLASLAVPKVPAASTTARVSLNPFAGLGHGARLLLADRPLGQSALGVAYFWGFGALVQFALVLVGRNVMGLDDWSVALLSHPSAGSAWEPPRSPSASHRPLQAPPSRSSRSVSAAGSSSFRSMRSCSSVPRARHAGGWSRP
jgi:acyl-[acyl-carrier-protein]-phospholipid O-acyltransferase/long-chain-fatty-acid--[acyl-carrier-protein] ligase